jgi:hypothetical protein
MSARRWQVTENTRYCPDCRQDQIFQPPHPGGSRCPDVADGRCPERLCARCGAALIVADVVYLPSRTVIEYPHRRVA